MLLSIGCLTGRYTDQEMVHATPLWLSLSTRWGWRGLDPPWARATFQVRKQLLLDITVRIDMFQFGAPGPF